jgi:hypothetical protein
MKSISFESGIYDEFRAFLHLQALKSAGAENICLIVK